MTTILTKLTKFFEVTKQSQLEQYINSKHPTTATEVEYWTRQYEQNNDGLYWSRGL
jgi:hypothetical protein